ncbi:MAG: alpha/beta hydrolase [Thermodesulfobacteriota bacterium]|nr:alpha/beta hydrolase [Thermodesulfobacteriota bacterium]
MMLSPNARLFNFYLKYCIKPIQVFLPTDHPLVMLGLRRIVNTGRRLINRVPAFVSIQQVDAGGVPGEWVTAGSAVDSKRIIFYLHGGGYFFCSPQTHRAVTWRLSRETKARVLSLDYRMVPEYTVDDCRTDAVKAYCWLLDQGHDPADIVIGGDSAGGGLTLLTLQALKQKAVPLPRAAFCLSPFADMSRTSPTFITNAKKSHLFHVNALRKVETYLSAGRDPYDPAISPAFGDFSGLPPLFIQAADTELLLHDSLLVARNALKAGVPVELNIWHNLPHVFSVFADILPEGKRGIKQIAGFVNRHLS